MWSPEQSGIATQSLSFQQDQRDLWTPRNRSVCIPTDPPTATILQLETRPTGRGNRRLSTELGNPEGVRQPSLVLYGESSESSDGAESPGSPGGSSLEGPAMVSSSSRYALGVPMTDSSSSRSHPESSKDGSTGAYHPASSVAYLRKKLTVAFQRKLQGCCWPPGGPSQTTLMIRTSESALAGVWNEVLILFQDL